MVPAAGSGSRLGSTDPKAFVQLNGKSLLVRSLETIISSGVASTIVVAAPEEFLMRAVEEIDSISHSCAAASLDDDAESVEDAGQNQITAVAGGKDRIESVQIALKHAEAADIVLVHDAARALTPPGVFRRVAAAVRSGAEAVVPVLPMTDTVRRAERRHSAEVLHGDLDRSGLRRVQTPQGFAADTLRRAHSLYLTDVAESGPDAIAPTDDAGLVERLGMDVVAVDGDEEALKITYPLDLVLGEHIVTTRERDHASASGHETTREVMRGRGGQ
ncbi:IspD/TarI family cytidylyltransferase [Brevibacterium marinum]|uniref:IspD/TarI family cytidylyltransferase n=1 Tax=Brevibacterium marinum TaxID=418643 RepID=UPI0031584336